MAATVQPPATPAPPSVPTQNFSGTIDGATANSVATSQSQAYTTAMGKYYGENGILDQQMKAYKGALEHQEDLDWANVGMGALQMLGGFAESVFKYLILNQQHELMEKREDNLFKLGDKSLDIKKDQVSASKTVAIDTNRTVKDVEEIRANADVVKHQASVRAARDVAIAQATNPFAANASPEPFYGVPFNS